MRKLVVVAAAVAVAAGGFDRCRFARGQSPAVGSERAAAVQPGQEAVIDLHRVFKELRSFSEELAALRARFKDFQKEQEAKLKAAANKQEVESKIADTVKEFQLAEAKLYHDGFERIRVAIAEHAKEHGIRVVRRSNTIARPDDQVDANDRKAVLERFNRLYLYVEEPAASHDITDAIVQRLNREDEVK